MARELARAAKTAKVIRQELKKVFPEVKFSVTSSNFSGGDSVHISWTDGPDGDIVDRIVKKYERYAGTDYTGDYAEFRSVDSDILGCDGAKYVQTSREVSAGRIAEIVEVMRAAGAYDCYMQECWNNENSAARNYEHKHPATWPEEYRIMWDKMEAERMDAYKKQEAESRAKYEQEEEEKKAAILANYGLNESDILDGENIIWSKMLAMSVSDISHYCGWGFSDHDVIELIGLHEAGVQREKIEDALDDANWHTEANLLSEGKYAECRKLYGVEVSEPPKKSNVIDFTARLAKRQEIKKAAAEKKAADEAVDRFKAEVLPTMTKSDIDRLQEAISSGDEEQYKNIMAQVLFKASMINHKEG